MEAHLWVVLHLAGGERLAHLSGVFVKRCRLPSVEASKGCVAPSRAQAHLSQLCSQLVLFNQQLQDTKLSQVSQHFIRVRESQCLTILFKHSNVYLPVSIMQEPFYISQPAVSHSNFKPGVCQWLCNYPYPPSWRYPFEPRCLFAPATTHQLPVYSLY